MSNGHLAGSFLTGTAGAWFVAVGELDTNPIWSLTMKLIVVVAGGLLAGITHHLGAKVAVEVLEAVAKLWRRK